MSPHIPPTGPDDHLLWVDETPPSFNAVGYTGNRWKLTKAVKEWKETLGTLLMVEKVPHGVYRHVSARVVLTFPRQVGRGRDAENYRVIISKALGDALEAARVIPNDTNEFFGLESVDIVIEKGVQKTQIFLTGTRSDAEVASLPE